MEDLTHNKQGRVSTGTAERHTARRRSAASILGVNVMLFLSFLALVIVLPPAVADVWQGVRSAFGLGPTGENWNWLVFQLVASLLPQLLPSVTGPSGRVDALGDRIFDAFPSCCRCGPRTAWPPPR